MENHTTDKEKEIKTIKQNLLDLFTTLCLIPIVLGIIFVLAVIFVSPFIILMYFSIPISSLAFITVILSIILIMFDSV